MGLQQRFGAEIDPADPAFAQAPPALRRKLYDAAGKLVLDELAKQLGKGIGRNGRAMKARIQPVLADGADGPVMVPHYLLSRAITLADYTATDRGLTLFWHAGTGHRSHRKARGKGAKATPFGTILGYHAAGEVPHAPVRDVRLSKARTANVKRAMEKLWGTMKPAPPPPEQPKQPKQPKRPKGPAPEIPPGRGPHLVDSRSFRTILPPKVPKASGFDAGAARAAMAAQKTAEAARRAAEKARLAEEAKRKAEAEARAKAEAARRAAEEEARLAAEARRKAAEEAARRKVEVEARKAREEAELLAARVAQEKAWQAAKAEADRLAARKAEHEARLAALEAARKADEARKPDVKAAGTLDRGALGRRLAGLESARPSARNAAILELVRENQSAATRAGRFHGMTSPETFRSVEFEGLKLSFLESAPEAIAPQVRALAAVPPIPRAIARHTRNVFLSSQTNEADARWAQQYNMPGFVSAATGGGGDVVVYKGHPISAGDLIHEMGHNLATATFGVSHPPPTTAYGRAIGSAEPPVSDYAAKSPAEDFAEAVRVYVEDPGSMKANHPLRYRAIKDLLDADTTS